MDLSLDTFLWFLVPHFRINCVLDVGARCGEYGVMLRNNGYSGHIISFEPVESNYRVLKQRCDRDSKWTAHQYALGSQNGTAEINVSQSSFYSSFRSASEYGRAHHPGIAHAATETVSVRRLDDIYDEVIGHVKQPRVYLKIDTQGWDLEVLRGAERSLASVPALQTEMSVKPLYQGSPTFRESLAAFNRAGYALSAVFAVARDSHFRLAEFDCVMVRDSEVQDLDEVQNANGWQADYPNSPLRESLESHS
jgi:FkbM family methyltransferase